MKHHVRSRVLPITLFALLVITLSGVTVHADDPVLNIYANGENACYRLDEIVRLGFSGDTLVVVTMGTTDYYAVDELEKIDFPSITTSVTSPETIVSLPALLHLFPNQPNPVSDETRISFRLPEPGHVDLRIYEVSGRLVRTLVSGDTKIGLHSVVWNGLDNSGRNVAAGVYFYRLSAPGIEESRRMILLH